MLLRRGQEKVSAWPDEASVTTDSFHWEFSVDPVAFTTPRALRAWGPRPARGTDTPSGFLTLQDRVSFGSGRLMGDLDFVAGGSVA